MIIIIHYSNNMYNDKNKDTNSYTNNNNTEFNFL